MDDLALFDRYNLLLTIAGCATAGGALALCGYWFQSRARRKQLRLKAKARANRTRRNIDELRKELVGLQINRSLVELSFKDLHEALQTGKVTAMDVLQAYQEKALEVNDKTNAITDIIASAKVLAAQLDSIAPDQRGPLHGIPISLKETCGLKGQDCTAGFAELIDVPLDQDSILVQVLKAKGAVPFIRTNCSQGMRSFCCVNGIYGETRNPHDPCRGPGGSSGGEGAVIGGLGSILGIGSDLGGSVRTPACFSGCCSIKPTSGRLGYLGNFNHRTVNGQNLVLSTDGPLGRDVMSLVQFLRAVLCPELWSLEPSVPPVPFNEEMYSNQKPLRIGFFIDNGCVRPVPSVERAVLLAKNILEAAGHELVEFDVKSDVLTAWCDIRLPLLFADNGQAYDELMRYDEAVPSFKAFYKSCKVSYWKGWFSYQFAKLMNQDVYSIARLKPRHFRTIDDWFKKTIFVQNFRQEFSEKMKREKIDLILCPGWPSPAHLASNIGAGLLSLPSYTTFFNALNFPAGIVPVTTVTAAVVTKTQDPKYYQPASDTERILQLDACGSEGLPVAVQVAGLPYMEEMLLRIMSQIEDATQFKPM